MFLRANGESHWAESEPRIRGRTERGNGLNPEIIPKGRQHDFQQQQEGLCHGSA